MMPPVSLPLKGGTISARAGPYVNIPHTATSIAIIRIADSIFWRTVKRIGGHEKNGPRIDGELSAGVAALHLTSPRLSRHRPRPASVLWIVHARPVLIASKTQPGCSVRRGVRAA